MKVGLLWEKKLALKLDDRLELWTGKRWESQLDSAWDVRMVGLLWGKLLGLMKTNKLELLTVCW